MDVFTVYDSKVKVYGNIFLAKNKGEALRMFQDVANDDKTQICKYPVDFHLIRIGTYDDLTGVIQGQDHENLGSADQYKGK